MLAADDGSHAAHLAVALSDDRDRVMAHFAALGIETAVHYPVADPDQPAFAHGNARAGDSLPVTAGAVSRVVSLPCFPELTESEIAAVTAAIVALA